MARGEETIQSINNLFSYKVTEYILYVAYLQYIQKIQ